MELTHNWNVWGHEWAVEFLQTSMAHKRNRHAYLITGTQGIGKFQLAIAFAMALNCENPEQAPCRECSSCKRIFSGNHPDLVVSELDNNSLKIDEIRRVMSLLALKPFSSRYRIALLSDFEKARPQAQDALLKTLEEPSRHAVLIVLASSTEEIMSTISSRCQIIPLRPVPMDMVKEVLMMHGADEDRAQLLARLSNGRVQWALNALKDDVVMEEREDMLNLLVDAIDNGRIRRFEIADELDKIGRKDKQAIHYMLETWQTYWRDVLLETQLSRIKPCNTDRLVHIQQLVQRITPDEALTALKATRDTMALLDKTNANTRMALEVMFLDYPGLHG